MSRLYRGLVGLFCERPVLALFLLFLSVGGGLYTTPLKPGGDLGALLEDLPREPVAVDAIPDLGENQQIVFTAWPGRSPQDVDDQVSYPLTAALLGLPGVRTVRSTSMFGFSSVYVIFEEGVEFYWSRSRILEKLASLPPGTLPPGAEPQLGPDATALGQVFWYTLEGRDDDGAPTAGWDLEELRRIQDWEVKFALLAAKDVSEVASIGGFQREVQVDVDPDRLRAFGIGLDQVAAAVRSSNLDVGARTMEVNGVEYLLRGVGFLEELEDIEGAVVAEVDGTPITVGELATVGVGPAARRGALDKAGQEAVGGVVVVRHGSNPMEAIEGVRAAAARLVLPSKVLVDWEQATPAQVERYAAARGFDAFLPGGALELDQEAWLGHLAAAGSDAAECPAWLTRSRVTLVPFYDRTELIEETLETLSSALVEELLITFVVIGLLVLHLGGAVLVGALLPLAVLLTFVAMGAFGVEANVVALSGIAIAIGTMVDMGIVITENVVARLDEARAELEAGLARAADVVREATVEVAGAVVTSVSTTVLSFLPVFAMTGAEGKLFTPLAATKTFALLASLFLALCLIPPAALVLFGGHRRAGRAGRLGTGWLVPTVLGALLLPLWWKLGAALLAFAAWRALSGLLGRLGRRGVELAAILVLVAWCLTLFADHWQPLGAAAGGSANLAFAASASLGLLLVFWLFRLAYPTLLAFTLRHKSVFLLMPAGLCLVGLWIWLGFGRVMAPVPGALYAMNLDGPGLAASEPWERADEAFPGIGSEFMPSLDEGMFLYMPTIAPHGSIGEALEALALEDVNIDAIPEVDLVVGKIGRAETPLDPAPVSMVETVIGYLPEYVEDEDGERVLYAWDGEAFLRDGRGELVELAALDDERRAELEGRPFRQWRDHIKSADDIWDEVVAAAGHLGATSAPKLQPIETRLVMLQTGMRAPYGVRLFGPDLASLDAAGLAIEELLKDTDGVEASAVFADRVTGKPYLEIELDRERLARHGIPIETAQRAIATAVGGMEVTRTVEGRERHPVRLRYPRELRGDPAALGRVLLQSSRPDAAPVPLDEVAELSFTRGPQAIKAEDARLVSYVLFDAAAGWSETETVGSAGARLEAALAAGELVLPPGVSYEFAGTWENQVRAKKTLTVLVPMVLLLILAILVLEFRSLSTSLFIFSGVAVAWAGGFLLIWLYGQPGFLDVEVLGTNLRDLFQVGPVHLSVAVWVGFLALFGIATDDGVVMATYLRQRFEVLRAKGTRPDLAAVRAAVVEAGQRRVRPCLATTATTLLALLPVLGSSGRGSEILVPMAIPAFGGMALELLTMFVLPVLWCAREEWRVLRSS